MVSPETEVPRGAYNLLVSNIANQMKEKLMIQNKFSDFLSKILLKFQIWSFLSGSKQPEEEKN